MGMKVFMVVSYLLIPLIMIGFGSLWKKRPPAKINVLYGYRSQRSMASREAWAFAHRYIGRIWVVSGWALLFVSMLFLYLYPDLEDAALEYTIFIFIQLFAMAAGIPSTEKALKERFPD